MIAVILASGDLERLYTGLSLLVSTAAEGEPALGLATFGALDALLDARLEARALRPEATPGLTEPGRATFARTLAELRDTAAELPECRIWACAAAVETTGADRAEVEARLDGVRSTPRVPARGGRRAAGGGLSPARARVVLGWSWPAAARGRPTCSWSSAAVRTATRTCGCSSPTAAASVQRRRSTRSTRTGCSPPGSSARPRAAGRAGLELPPGAGTQLTYRASMEGGTIAFSDRSEDVPRTFQRLAAFTTDVTERVCGIER